MGTEQAIRSAAGEGYEAVVLVVVLLGMFSLLGYLVKQWIAKATEREDKILQQAYDREARLSARITSLEDFVRSSLIEALAESTKAMLTVNLTMSEAIKSHAELRESLHSTRPCWWSQEKQDKIIEVASERLVSHLLTIVNNRISQPTGA